SSGGPWIIDVNDLVQGFINGTYDNYGFQIHRDGSPGDGFLEIRSKEISEPSWWPYLYLNYTPSAVESTTLGEIKAVFK
ncbi:MAG: hypothetical protein GY771_14515, partial [bacterium]|nr:hypothetical protein [bacterium]